MRDPGRRKTVENGAQSLEEGIEENRPLSKTYLRNPQRTKTRREWCLRA
jgi:hypothetical protein